MGGDGIESMFRRRRLANYERQPFALETPGIAAHGTAVLGMPTSCVVI